MGKKKQTNGNNQDKVTYEDPRDAYLSTKAEMVVAKSSMAMSVFYENNENSKAVIAEDKNGFYLTCMSYVNAPVLDPYRQYNRLGKNNEVKIIKTDTGFDIEYRGNIYSCSN